MGYDIHITRAEDWEQNKGLEIPSKEWLSFVESDPELERDPANGEFAVFWKAESSPPGAWFDWYAGNVFTTNPEPAVIEKALRMARALGGRVQGDDGNALSTAPAELTLRQSPQHETTPEEVTVGENAPA